MRTVAFVVLLFFVSALACAQGPKPCEVLKSEIAKKLDAEERESIHAGDRGQGPRRGRQGCGRSCEGGTMKIVYSKPAPAAKTVAPAVKKH